MQCTFLVGYQLGFDCIQGGLSAEQCIVYTFLVG